MYLWCFFLPPPIALFCFWGQGRFALHVASKALEYYAETVFKVPYPLKKSDLLAIPGEHAFMKKLRLCSFFSVCVLCYVVLLLLFRRAENSDAFLFSFSLSRYVLQILMWTMYGLRRPRGFASLAMTLVRNEGPMIISISNEGGLNWVSSQ